MEVGGVSLFDKLHIIGLFYHWTSAGQTLFVSIASLEALGSWRGWSSYAKLLVTVGTCRTLRIILLGRHGSKEHHQCAKWGERCHRRSQTTLTTLASQDWRTILNGLSCGWTHRNPRTTPRFGLSWAFNVVRSLTPICVSPAWFGSIRINLFLPALAFLVMSSKKVIPFWHFNHKDDCSLRRSLDHQKSINCEHYKWISFKLKKNLALRHICTNATCILSWRGVSSCLCLFTLCNSKSCIFYYLMFAFISVHILLAF